MSLIGGLSAQFGMADETTYATVATPTRFLEFNQENVNQTIERLESGGLRPKRRMVRANQVLPGRIACGGDVEFDVNTQGFGLVFKHCLNTVTSSQPNAGSNPTVWEHLAEIGEADDKSFTAQFGKADMGGTVRAFTYAGCKIVKWELVCDENGLLKLKATLAGASESTAVALASASYASTAIPLSYRGGVLNMAGAELLVKKFALAGDNQYITDRYAMRAANPGQRREPLSGGGLRQYTGNIETEFEGLTQYERFVNTEVGELTAFFTGPIISGTYAYAVEVTLPAVRYDGDTPNVSGAAMVNQSLPFKVLDTGVAKGPVQIKYRTIDTTP